MANYTRQGTTFRSDTSPAGGEFPALVVGALSRVYDGIQTLTLSGSAQSLTVPGVATHADIYCTGSTSADHCRYWHDGTNPTSTVGVKLYDRELLESGKPSGFKAINASGACTLSIEYYHYA